MREKIAWITDSTGFLHDEHKKNPDVYVVPMIVIINGKEYKDGVDLMPEQLFSFMKQDKVIPTTSQPSVGTFADLSTTELSLSMFPAALVVQWLQASRQLNWFPYRSIHSTHSLFLSQCPRKFLLVKQTRVKIVPEHIKGEIK
nr:DegV family protein [Bacillus sp. V5-8f]